MTDYVDPIPEPPGQTVLDVFDDPKNARRRRIGSLLFTQSMPWLRWLVSLLPMFRQIRISGQLNFGNTAAQTSSAELTIAFTLGGQDVPVNSFISDMRVLDTVTELPVALPANAFFTYRMSAANVIAVRFNNFSSAAIDPGPFLFEFLITLRR